MPDEEEQQDAEVRKQQAMMNSLEDSEQPDENQKPRNAIGLYAYMMEPAAQSIFEEISRDLRMGNLTGSETYAVKQLLSFYKMLVRHKRTQQAAGMFLHDAYLICIISGSRGGKFLDTLNPNIKRTTFEDTTKKTGMFSFNKRE